MMKYDFMTNKNKNLSFCSASDWNDNKMHLNNSNNITLNKRIQNIRPQLRIITCSSMSTAITTVTQTSSFDYDTKKINRIEATHDNDKNIAQLSTLQSFKTFLIGSSSRMIIKNNVTMLSIDHTKQHVDVESKIMDDVIKSNIN